MVKEGDKLVVGDLEFRVEIVSKLKLPPNLIMVVVSRHGVSLEQTDPYLITMPRVFWESAVRGAWFPTNEELIRLKNEYDVRHYENIELQAAASEYIDALEARVRKLTEENQRWSTANSKAVEDLLRGTEDLENRLTKIRGLAQGILEADASNIIAEDTDIRVRDALEAIEKETVLDDGEEND